jgi:hypothetical protein
LIFILTDKFGPASSSAHSTLHTILRKKCIFLLPDRHNML